MSKNTHPNPGLGKSLGEILDKTTEGPTAVGIILGATNKLRESMNNDDLTKVTSKAVWFDALKNTLDSNPSSEVCVFFIDLKDFKGVNDKQGHQKGDEVLKLTANILKSTFRSGDNIAIAYESEEERNDIGRLGGDEFGVILDLSNIGSLAPDEYISSVMGRLTNNFYSNPQIQNSGVGITIGYAVWDGKESAQDLLNRADKSMYEEKESQKAKYGSHR